MMDLDSPSAEQNARWGTTEDEEATIDERQSLAVDDAEDEEYENLRDDEDNA